MKDKTVLTVSTHSKKPLKRFGKLWIASTGLKPGVNEKFGRRNAQPTFIGARGRFC
jgi:hypothetical protein